MKNSPEPNQVVVARLKIFTRFAALFSALAGSVALLGWAFGIAAFKTILPALSSMKPNTAVCIALTGVSLWLLGAHQRGAIEKKVARHIATVLAMLAGGIGVATVCQYAFGWNLNIDQLLFKDLVPDGHSIPGRMSPLTALSFSALASALLQLAVETKRGHRPAQLLSFIPGLISLAAILGYLYSAVSFYQIRSYTGMALHTAVATLLLSLGVFFFYPDRGLAALITADGPGGIVARRLLPAAFLVPTTIGWVRMEGQKAGLYGTELGLALMVATNIFVFSILVYLSGLEIQHEALGRGEAEKGRRELNYTLYSLVSAFPLPVVAMDRDANVRTWNPAAEHVFGWSPLQVSGNPNPLICADRREEYDTLMEIMRQGDPVLGIETVVQSRDDVHIPVVLWGAPIILGTHEVAGFVTIMEDQRKRDEQENQIKTLQSSVSSEES
jgi:PAS domain S-box-containing protein